MFHMSSKFKEENTKMPAQTYANGMAMSEVPPELSNLSDLECRIISLHIPFMVIFCLVRYGSQYKIWVVAQMFLLHWIK